METRLLSKIKEEIVPGPSFEQVTVKEEPQDVLDESGEYHVEVTATKGTSHKRMKAASNTNICYSVIDQNQRNLNRYPRVPSPCSGSESDDHSQCASSEDSLLYLPTSPDMQSSQQPKATVRKKSRYTQVIPEDIDLTNMKRFNRFETLGENKPIDPTGLGEVIPQCRLCLRRVSRENLEIIVGKHQKKARVAFQVRIFPHDAYPFICSNCSSLMDIFIDFKNAVIQAKSLLVSEKTFLESDGWDDPDYVDAFKKCKQIVELHRKQIDTLYENRSKLQKREYGDHVNDDNADNNHSVENDHIDDLEHESNIKHESIIIEEVVPSHSNDDLILKNGERNAEGVESSCPELEVAESVADDSMDEDFNPEDEEEEDDEDCDLKAKKPKIIKAKQSDTPADACEDKPHPQENKSLVPKKLCDFCGESVRPESMESHRNRHLGIRPYACSVADCQLSFTSRFNLGHHIKRIHCEIEERIHTCNICGKQIRGTPAVLRYHQQRHNVDQKRHICQVCGKGFTMKWYLTQHSIIHTGEFPHKCKYCGKKFNNKWSMKTHEKNIHEKKNQIPIEENQTWNPANFPQVEPQTHFQ